MTNNRTTDEVRQHHLEMLGDNLGILYHALWNELAWLYTKWGEYDELFGKKVSRIELINKVAGRFFRVVQDTLWDDSLLHIARLTDRKKSGKKENLSIRMLPDLIENDELKEKVAALIDISIDKTDFARDWRNRRIAHKDFDLILNKNAAPLMPASRLKVKEALNSISDVMNAIAHHYMDSTTVFETIGSSGNAVSLLYIINDGLRLQKNRYERLKAGHFRPEDYPPHDL